MPGEQTRTGASPQKRLVVLLLQLPIRQSAVLTGPQGLGVSDSHQAGIIDFSLQRKHNANANANCLLCLACETLHLLNISTSKQHSA